MKRLSHLATDSEVDDAFGKDFNEFMKLVVNAFNKCAMIDNMFNADNAEDDEDLEDDEDDDGIDKD